jgi:uncharacterized protein (DUF2147 family)
MTLKSLLLATGLGFALIAPLQAGAQNTAQKDEVLGHWLTDDGALIIEVTACEEGTDYLCGFIRALPGAGRDPELAKYASELCGLPLLSNLGYNENKKRWDGGEIFDPESEQLYDVHIQAKKKNLIVRAYDGRERMGETYKWPTVPASTLGCDDAEGHED